MTPKQKLKKEETDLRTNMYRLDWVKILQNAIARRTTSWKMWETEFQGIRHFDPPVIEWKNASDEICIAVIEAMENHKLFDNLKKIKTKRGH